MPLVVPVVTNARRRGSVLHSQRRGESFVKLRRVRENRLNCLAACVSGLAPSAASCSAGTPIGGTSRSFAPRSLPHVSDNKKPSASFFRGRWRSETYALSNIEEGIPRGQLHTPAFSSHVPLLAQGFSREQNGSAVAAPA